MPLTRAGAERYGADDDAVYAVRGGHRPSLQAPPLLQLGGAVGRDDTGERWVLFRYLELKEDLRHPPRHRRVLNLGCEPSDTASRRTLSLSSNLRGVGFVPSTGGSPVSSSSSSSSSSVLQVTADTLTLGLMVWASALDPDISGEKKTIDNIYVGCMLIQVGGPLKRVGGARGLAGATQGWLCLARGYPFCQNLGSSVSLRLCRDTTLTRGLDGRACMHVVVSTSREWPPRRVMNYFYELLL